jgi:hypothetical protein
MEISTFLYYEVNVFNFPYFSIVKQVTISTTHQEEGEKYVPQSEGGSTYIYYLGS